MTTPTTNELLTAISAHLTASELPPIASVLVTAAISAPHVTVQLASRDPAAIARGLLTWADTLTQVTAQARRIPRGNSVHLSVTGLLTDGATVLVYGAMPIPEHGPGADLAPDATTIPLATLQRAPTPREARDR